MPSKKYGIGDITLLTSKSAYLDTDGNEHPLPETPYQILLSVVERSQTPVRETIPLDIIAADVWPTDVKGGVSMESLTRRIQSHVFKSRSCRLTCLSKGVKGGYKLEGDLVVVPASGGEFDTLPPSADIE